MSLFNQIDKDMKQKGAVYVGDTHVYNIHSFKNKGKNSILNKYFHSLPKLPDGFDYVAIVGAMGRSQHSKTALHVYKISDKEIVFDIGRDYFYYNN